MPCAHGTKDRSSRNAAAFATASNFFFLFVCLVPWSASADSDPPGVPSYNPSQDVQQVPHWRGERVRGEEAARVVFEESHDRKATAQKRRRRHLTGEKPSSRHGRSAGSIWVSRQSSKLLGAAALALVAFILWQRRGFFPECLPKVRRWRRPGDAGPTPRLLAQSTTDARGGLCAFLLSILTRGRKDPKHTAEGGDEESEFKLLTVDGMLKPESGNTENGHPSAPLERRWRRLRLALIILGVALVLAAVIGGFTYALVGKDTQEAAAQDLSGETLTGTLDVYCELDEKLTCEGKVDSPENTEPSQKITEERDGVSYTFKIPEQEYKTLVKRNSLGEATEIFLKALQSAARDFDRTYGGGSSSKTRFDLGAYKRLLEVV